MSSTLAAHLELRLDKLAEDIRALGKRALDDIIEIGRRLIEAKEIAGHGNWLPWLEREFGWTTDTAQNFMSVASATSKNGNFPNLNVPISGLYLLAAPSTPAKVIEAVGERSERGERVSLAAVRREIAMAKGISIVSAAKPPSYPYPPAPPADDVSLRNSSSMIESAPGLADLRGAPAKPAATWLAEGLVHRPDYLQEPDLVVDAVVDKIIEDDRLSHRGSHEQRRQRLFDRLDNLSDVARQVKRAIIEKDRKKPPSLSLVP
jgi:hypothetical protein